jgi:hypothetical protein
LEFTAGEYAKSVYKIIRAAAGVYGNIFKMRIRGMDMASFKPRVESKDERLVAIPTKTESPQTFEQALAGLRGAGYGPAADVLESRVSQERQKMKLTPEEARQIANYLLEGLPNMPECAALLQRMPRATVEIVRAVRERGVESGEAERMAQYLSHFLDIMDLGNPGRFDESVSHVIGRTYEQIDWSGENTSAEDQRRSWERYGVPDFRTAEHYHNYLRHAVTMRWFTRAFQPRGTLPESFEDVLGRE